MSRLSSQFSLQDIQEESYALERVEGSVDVTNENQTMVF